CVGSVWQVGKQRSECCRLRQLRAHAEPGNQEGVYLRQAFPPGRFRDSLEATLGRHGRWLARGALLGESVAFKELPSLRTNQETKKIWGSLLILAALDDRGGLPDGVVQISRQQNAAAIAYQRPRHNRCLSVTAFRVLERLADALTVHDLRPEL